MTITKERLEEIKARVDAAGEGPWGHVRAHVVHVIGADGEPAPRTGMRPAGDTFPRVVSGADYGGTLDFIASARQDVPALVEEVERLQGLLKEVEWKGSIFGTAVCLFCEGTPVDPEGDKHNDWCPAFTPEGKVK